MSIYPRHLYEAAALNAFLSRGYVIDVAVELAKEVAQKMREEHVDDIDSELS